MIFPAGIWHRFSLVASAKQQERVRATANSQGREHGLLSHLEALTALWDRKLLLGWADASVNFVSPAASSQCSLKRKVNKVLRGKSGGSCLRKAMGSGLAGRNGSSPLR